MNSINQLSQVSAPKTSRGQKTLEKILHAAELEFGERGFHEGSIAGIAQRAEIGQGTFYLYFKCKEDVLRELVLYLNRVIRHFLTQETISVSNRIEAERIGLRAFLQYIKQHPNLYRVLQESQFVDPEVHRAYYMSFAEAYAGALERAWQGGEIRKGEFEVWAWAIMGAMHFIGQRYMIWQNHDDIDHVVDEVISLMGYGLVDHG